MWLTSHHNTIITGSRATKRKEPIQNDDADTTFVEDGDAVGLLKKQKRLKAAANKTISRAVYQTNARNTAGSSRRKVVQSETSDSDSDEEPDKADKAPPKTKKATKKDVPVNLETMQEDVKLILTGHNQRYLSGRWTSAEIGRVLETVRMKQTDSVVKAMKAETVLGTRTLTYMENNQSALADQAKAERDLAAAALLVVQNNPGDWVQLKLATTKVEQIRAELDSKTDDSRHLLIVAWKEDGAAGGFEKLRELMEAARMP